MSGSDTIVGQVKWFSNQLNYGFVTVLSEGEHNGIDVFVHQTNITPQVSNYRTLTQGEYVSFNLTHNEGDKHPYHGTNLTGYGGGKLLCDFQQFVPKQQRDGFNNDSSGKEGGQKKEYRSRDNSN